MTLLDAQRHIPLNLKTGQIDRLMSISSDGGHIPNPLKDEFRKLLSDILCESLRSIRLEVSVIKHIDGKVASTFESKEAAERAYSNLTPKQKRLFESPIMIALKKEGEV